MTKQALIRERPSNGRISMTKQALTKARERPTVNLSTKCNTGQQKHQEAPTPPSLSLTKNFDLKSLPIWEKIIVFRALTMSYSVLNTLFYDILYGISFLLMSTSSS